MSPTVPPTARPLVPAPAPGPTTAIVLAGGLGTRLRGAVPDLPKPLAPVAGRPFLEHQLEHWIGQGIRRFVLAVGYRHQAIVDAFGDRWGGATIGYSVESTPLGTGGALRLAARHVDDDERVLVLNGDTWFDAGLPALARFARLRDADWCFALFRTDEPGRYMGMRVGSDGRIAALRHDDATPGRLANGGVYVVRTRLLREAAGAPSGAVSLEDDLLPAWLAGGRRVYGLHCAGAFVDIGVPDDWRRAASVIGAVATPAHHAAEATTRG